MNPDQDRYSKTMTLHMLYVLLDFVAEFRDVRSERDGLQLMLDSAREELAALRNGDGEKVINMRPAAKQRKGK